MAMLFNSSKLYARCAQLAPVPLERGTTADSSTFLEMEDGEAQMSSTSPSGSSSKIGLRHQRPEVKNYAQVRTFVHGTTVPWKRVFMTQEKDSFLTEIGFTCCRVFSRSAVCSVLISMP